MVVQLIKVATGSHFGLEMRKTAWNKKKAGFNGLSGNELVEREKPTKFQTEPIMFDLWARCPKHVAGLPVRSDCLVERLNDLGNKFTVFAAVSRDLAMGCGQDHRKGWL